MNLNESTKQSFGGLVLENDSLLTLKNRYISAMSQEMKSPLKAIISIVNDLETTAPQRAGEIKEAARYLLSLVEELGQAAQR